jgi:hypothetical protein
MAGLIAGAEIMFGDRTPHPYHTRPGLLGAALDVMDMTWANGEWCSWVHLKDTG